MDSRSGAFGRWHNDEGAAKGCQIGSERWIIPICAQIGVPVEIPADQDAVVAGLKPSGHPTLVRTRHQPLRLARGSRRDQRPVSAETQRLKALQALLSRHIAAPTRDVWLHAAEGRQYSAARPVPMRQNSRF
jgi:hypothetical protein